MTEILIYTTTVCPYCIQAKRLLEKYNLSYREILIDQDPNIKAEMIQRSNGRRTVPQIFINGEHIGGYDDLVILEKQGKLADFI